MDDVVKYLTLVQAWSPAGKGIVSALIIIIGGIFLYVIWQNPPIAELPSRPVTTDSTPNSSATVPVGGVVSNNQVGGQTAQTIVNNNVNAPSDINNETLHISYDRVTVFFIKANLDVYQVGVVIRLFNRDNVARVLKGIKFDPLTFHFSGGNGYTQKIFISASAASLDEDVVIQPQTYRDVKILLPITFFANLHSVLEFVFLTPFEFEFQNTTRMSAQAKAYRYGNFRQFIDLNEWANILTSTSHIDLNNLTYRRTPSNIDGASRTGSYIMFNPDPSAAIDIYGFSHTEVRRSTAGAVVLLSGFGNPSGNGWVVLARDYKSLQQHPIDLAKYLAVLPLDSNGQLVRLDAGFRAAAITFIGPIDSSQIPWTCDFTAQPPSCSTVQ